MLSRCPIPPSLTTWHDPEIIAARVREIAADLSRRFAGREPVVVGVLKGAFIFMADLVRAMDIAVKIDFIQVASYGAGTTSSGTVRLVKDLGLVVKDEDVILVDDILDTGLTLRFVIDKLAERHPRSLTTCVLIDKRERRRVEVPVAHVGFALGRGFVAGYGIDKGEAYRNLAGLYIVEGSEKP